MLAKVPLTDLKLKLSKCKLYYTNLHCLGHVVSQSGIEADLKKIAAIINWHIPETVTDVLSIYGSPIITVDLFITMLKFPAP